MAGERPPLMIAVLGSADCPPEAAAAAEAVGRELAVRGATVVCGGRGGVMEAACRGARAAGGHTIAVLPGYDREQANPYVEFAIPTGWATPATPSSRSPATP